MSSKGDGVRGMRIRSACGAGTLFVATMLSVVLFTFQAPAAGQQRGAAPAPAPAGPGGRGGAPVGALGGRGGPRIPDGALRPDAPHPDTLPVDIFTTKNFYKDRAL